jgi:GNAT superfamily N-acetyltransferase
MLSRNLYAMVRLARGAGLPYAAAWLLDKILERRTNLSLLVVHLHRPETFALPRAGVDARYTIRILNLDDFKAIAVDVPEEMRSAFLDDALAKGDQCIGVLDGTRVVSFQWFSRKATYAYDNMAIAFNDGLLYGYHVFTLPEYRGRGFHGATMYFAAHTLLTAQDKGLVGYARFGTAASILGGRKAGSVEAGYVFVWNRRSGPRYAMTSVCRELGVALCRLTEPA